MSLTNIELYNNSLLTKNLEDNDSISGLLQIYFENNKLIQESINNPINFYSADYLIKKYKEDTSNSRYIDIRKELFKTHLEEVYYIFDQLAYNKDIYTRLNKENIVDITQDAYSFNISNNVNDSINSQYIDVSRSFKMKKGTKEGFFFIDDLINKVNVQGLDTEQRFELIDKFEDGKQVPFKYTVQTSLYKELVREAIIPLAHPLGWVWDYINILTMDFTDYFLNHKELKIKELLITTYRAKEEDNTVIDVLTDELYGTIRSVAEIDENEDNAILNIDFYPKNDQSPFKLKRFKDGRVILYATGPVIMNEDLIDCIESDVSKEVYKDVAEGSLIELKVKKIKLAGVVQGVIVPINSKYLFGYETLDAIEGIHFSEFSIFDYDYVDLEFQLHNDLDSLWYGCRMPLPKKTVSTDKKYFNPIVISSQDMISRSKNINGIIINDFGFNSVITYKADTFFKSDIIDYSNRVTSSKKLVLEHTIESNDYKKLIDDFAKIETCDFIIGDTRKITDCLTPEQVKLSILINNQKMHDHAGKPIPFNKFVTQNIGNEKSVVNELYHNIIHFKLNEINKFRLGSSNTVLNNKTQIKDMNLEDNSYHYYDVDAEVYKDIWDNDLVKYNTEDSVITSTVRVKNELNFYRNSWYKQLLSNTPISETYKVSLYNYTGEQVEAEVYRDIWEEKGNYHYNNTLDRCNFKEETEIIDLVDIEDNIDYMYEECSMIDHFNTKDDDNDQDCYGTRNDDFRFNVTRNGVYLDDGNMQVWYDKYNNSEV